MIYVIFRGRLGNQLFQYAFAKKISMITGDDIYFDWDIIDKRTEREKGNYWGRELNEFKISDHIDGNGVKLSSFQKILWRLSGRNFRKGYLKKHKIIRIFLYKILSFWGMYLYQDGFISYTYFGHKDKYLYGYFESPRFFEGIKEELLNEFVPRKSPLDKNRKLYEVINCTESICVSVRRTDFLDKENINGCGVCSVDYYRRGVKKIQERYPDAVVILFSDDINWARENLHFDAETFSETGDDPVWEKLRLMYSCKHFVLSNSTFSWWAQYLSRNENKMVVGPIPWRVDDIETDLYEENWICIER